MTQPQQDGSLIAIEDAFPVYRNRCTELFDENMLLRSQVAGLQRQVAELTQPEPVQGPDLANQPPYPDPNGGDPMTATRS